MAKELYKIGEFSRLLNVTPRTIRYYDQVGLLPQIKRSDGGIRLFDEEDIRIIKKVRVLQKEKFLQLEEIKETLFTSKKTCVNSTAIITDATCVLTNYNNNICNVFPLKTHLDKPINSKAVQGILQLWESGIKKQVMPYFQLPDSKDILAVLEKLAQEGVKTVFGIASSTSFQSLFSLYEEISYNINIPVEFYPINSNTFGTSTGLLINYVQSLIESEKSIAEIKLSISKSIPLLYQIGFTQSLETFQKLTVTSKSFPIINELNAFCPIYKVENGALSVTECLPTYQAAIDALSDKVAQLIIQRKKYLYKIIVSYSYFYSEATMLCNQLKQKYPNTEVDICEIPIEISTIVGPKSINIAIL